MFATESTNTYLLGVLEGGLELDREGLLGTLDGDLELGGGFGGVGRGQLHPGGARALLVALLLDELEADALGGDALGLEEAGHLVEAPRSGASMENNGKGKG